jgi:hypothetical protein
MTILFGDFNDKAGTEDIFRHKIGNKNLQEISNQSNKLHHTQKSKKSTIFPHRNIQKCMWTSPDGKPHNQIEHILRDGIHHSSILDVQSFRGADCDTNHYLMVAEVRERQAIST